MFQDGSDGWISTAFQTQQPQHPKKSIEATRSKHHTRVTTSNEAGCSRQLCSHNLHKLTFTHPPSAGPMRRLPTLRLFSPTLHPGCFRNSSLALRPVSMTPFLPGPQPTLPPDEVASTQRCTAQLCIYSCCLTVRIIIVAKQTTTRTGTTQTTTKKTLNHPLPLTQFQDLFHSLLKVLFIFPSQYLYAIGVQQIFSMSGVAPAS